MHQLKLVQPISQPPRPDFVSSPALSVVIVNYCQWRNTARLVRQLLASPAVKAGLVEIVVVDNHSPYHPCRKRLRRTAGVSLRCLRQNRGFGRGVNEGCRLSRGSWYLLLNPDVTTPPKFLEQALDCLSHADRNDPRVGIIGLQLRDPSGARQGSVGVKPTLLGTLLALFRPRPQRKCRVLPANRPANVGWVTGCGMLIRRECFQQLGGFDPDFFLYYEDADLCLRARAGQWTVRHEPSLHVIHHHPLHSRTASPRLRLLTRHSLLTFAKKHWPAWQTPIIAILVFVEALWRGRRTHRKQMRIALDFMLGQDQCADRRVRRVAQLRRSREGIDLESAQARRRNGRRPLPR